MDHSIKLYKKKQKEKAGCVLLKFQVASHLCFLYYWTWVDVYRQSVPIDIEERETAFTMAELIPLVSPLLKLVMDKLGSGLWKELELLQGVKKDIEKLQSTLSTIKDVLEDAEQRSISDKPLCNWLKKLKDAAYDADDVMEEIQTEALRRRMENDGHPLKGQVRDFFSSHNHIAFRHRIALKIKDLLERLDAIAEEKSKFHWIQGSVSLRPRHEETHSVVIQSEVYGRDEDKDKVLNFLLNENNDEDLSVLAIIGLGGLGKTTLAQLVYNDESIKSSFDLRGWICVSVEFDVRGITRKIIQSIKKEVCGDLELDPLGQLLRKTLGGQKFILVLDDVWNEDRQKWDKLKSLLRCGNKGSKILVTTRSEHVASVMGSVLSHRLKGLSADDCWNLFRERAFGLGREKESPVLIEIGKKIVNKCGGLPLAAKALGSLMGSKREEHEWLAIQNSDIWNLNDENEILPALRLSYYHLPSYLKQCFVYCSLFPKDYVFVKEELISLWIGEGFVQSSNEGNKYFNSLSRRSFFDQIVQEYDYINRADEYKMHDLMHDLACSAAKDEFRMMTVHEEVKVTDNCHYLSLITDDTSPNILGLSSETKKLRSLLLVINKYSFIVKEIKWDVLLRQSHIRVLDLHRSGISVLPSAICRLKHLRLLNLSRTRIKKLPQTICSMYNLSTLILSYCSSLEELPSTISRLPNLCTLNLSNCYELRELPSTISMLPNLCTLNLSNCGRLRELPGGMSQMNNLTHLDIYGCYQLRDMPAGMGRLTNLQTMSTFIVGEEDGCRITELKGLNQIRGHLQIVNLHKVRSSMEAEEANLRAKVHVKHLELNWGWVEVQRRENATATEVIESLHPPPNVEVLKISNYRGSRLPSWMMMMSGSTEPPTSLFRNLVQLELDSLRRCEDLPSLGQLPFLKFLKIGGMDGVRRIGGEEFYGQPAEVGGGGGGRDYSVPFPVLENLSLRNMSNMEEWVVEAAGGIERERMFPSLTSLIIDECPKLRRVQPGLPVSIEYLSIRGGDDATNEELLPTGSLAGLSRVRYLDMRNCKTLSPTSSWWEELHYLTALETLTIYGCEELTCLPEGIIQHHFPSLQTLYLSSNENLTSLGDPQQQTPPLLFTSLHHLRIHDCTALTSLPEWLGGLTSLQSLDLGSCPDLEMLPEGLQHLAALQTLRIWGCPLLERRCERETGGDWHKIAHIPNIFPRSVEEPQQETTRRRIGGCNWIRGGDRGLASCLKGHQGPPLA